MKKKIRRRCKCGCGGITNYGKKYICGHTWGNKNLTKEARKKMSVIRKGRKQSKKLILKRSLAKIKYDPNYKYCDIWKDREYLKDIRKDYCENKDCKSNYKLLSNHHIYLDKKRCAPDEVITLCNSCHMILHCKLRRGTRKPPINPKDFIIINRPDHISYIHKKSREVIKVIKR